MKKAFILLTFIILLKTSFQNICKGVKEVESLHKDILGNKTIGELAELGTKKEQKDGSMLFILNSLTPPLYLKISKNDEKTQKNYSLLKKFTASYEQDEFKPFTYFIDCIETKGQDDQIILLYGNAGLV